MSEQKPNPLVQIVTLIILVYLTLLVGTCLAWLVDVTGHWMLNYWRD